MAQASPNPSYVDVPRPSSSTMMSELDDALFRIDDISSISAMNVDTPFSWESDAPTRASTESKIQISAPSAAGILASNSGLMATMDEWADEALSSESRSIVVSTISWNLAKDPAYSVTGTIQVFSNSCLMFSSDSDSESIEICRKSSRSGSLTHSWYSLITSSSDLVPRGDASRLTRRAMSGTSFRNCDCSDSRRFRSSIRWPTIAWRFSISATSTSGCLSHCDSSLVPPTDLQLFNRPNSDEVLFIELL
ncbi:hypothetical protein OGAPHI_000960 [Ogataea philodendri]|uniref:Uncharacterized protein n=1 Tax=Ogataea philodendri TaxID=1378263 RepID=A0A9P8T9M5_9ASCO|nr:uncharacterized protein OGAPHI_000960 [Ogataea philodendri]KAH3670445.1 hypothetical protein OGAPHI_000960 [Ogataea philodendri]